MPNLPVRLGKGVSGCMVSRSASPGARHRADGRARPCRMDRRRACLRSADLARPAAARPSSTASSTRSPRRGLRSACRRRRRFAFCPRRPSKAPRRLAATGGLNLEERVREVASKKGTTEAGLLVLDAELDDLVLRTLEAARRREPRNGGRSAPRLTRFDLCAPRRLGGGAMSSFAFEPNPDPTPAEERARSSSSTRASDGCSPTIWRSRSMTRGSAGTMRRSPRVGR